MSSNETTYERITERVLDALEAGTVPWDRGWSAVDVPRSLSTGKPYQGINVLLLGMQAAAAAYSSPYWGTYRAIKDRGGQVRAGEKGTAVVFWKVMPRKVSRDESTGEETEQRKGYAMLKTFIVFNSEQADGLEHLTPPAELPSDPIAEAELIFESTSWDRPPVQFGGDSAHYSPALDYVQLPLRSSFETAELFYSTAFHELGHATGHEKRLGRDLTGSFGSPSYAREELVAELTAAFLCGRAGIEKQTEERSAAYLAHWASVLRSDKSLIVKAAGGAQKAADLIAGELEASLEPTRDFEAAAA